MSSPPDLGARSRSSDRDLGHDVWLLFALTWAAAVLFHLAGNPTLAPTWGRVFLGLAAVAVLARPIPWSAVVLAVAVLANVWLEAPILGNHWLLHGLIALVVLGSVVGAQGDPARSIARIVGPARLVLLAFYGFAAFAKLNSDFFEPAVSCATFYFRESADSWGAASLVDGLPLWSDRLIAVLVAAVELSIPMLLVVRRTRSFAVVAGLSFHYLLAIDRTHQFFDFSSVLVSLFLLFLHPETVGCWFERVRARRDRIRARWDSGPDLLAAAVYLLCLASVAVAAGPTSWGGPGLLRNVGVVVWLAYGAAAIVGVVLALRDEPGVPEPLLGAGAPRWLLLVPAVAVLNGLSPYLEVKSGTGWNMYSNLAVVDGESNHFVVRSGLPMTDGHRRLVRVTGSSDRSLDFYVDSGWLLPERQLLDHLAGRSGVVVTGSVDGVPVTYDGGDGDARPSWQQKFQVFRAVDADGPTDCQPSFGPAR